MQGICGRREESEARIRELHEAGIDDDDRVVASRNNLALLELAGIRYATVESHRGRRLKWTPERLAEFARGLVEVGDRWSAEHETWARAHWDLNRRQASEVMSRAERIGIVYIAKSGGANVYSRQHRGRT